MDTAELIAQWESRNILENKIIKFLTEDNFIIQWVKNKYLGIFSLLSRQSFNVNIL